MATSAHMNLNRSITNNMSTTRGPHQCNNIISAGKCFLLFSFKIYYQINKLDMNNLSKIILIIFALSLVSCSPHRLTIKQREYIKEHKRRTKEAKDAYRKSNSPTLNCKVIKQVRGSHSLAVCDNIPQGKNIANATVVLKIYTPLDCYSAKKLYAYQTCVIISKQDSELGIKCSKGDIELWEKQEFRMKIKEYARN